MSMYITITEYVVGVPVLSVDADGRIWQYEFTEDGARAFGSRFSGCSFQASSTIDFPEDYGVTHEQIAMFGLSH